MWLLKTFCYCLLIQDFGNYGNTLITLSRIEKVTPC